MVHPVGSYSVEIVVFVQLVSFDITGKATAREGC